MKIPNETKTRQTKLNHSFHSEFDKLFKRYKNYSNERDLFSIFFVFALSSDSHLRFRNNFIKQIKNIITNIDERAKGKKL